MINPAPDIQRDEASWRFTPDGKPRGYIQPHALTELWFHTGTICNLRCPFCLEGSQPGDNRINQITLEDAQPLIDEAVDLGVEQFSFTGGEPFVNREIVRILDYALDRRPCMVLTNGTRPLRSRVGDVLALRSKPNALRFRISLDHPDPERHDAERGRGNFELSLSTLGDLHAHGFRVSIARLGLRNEDTALINAQYLPFFERAGLPADTHITVFPDFHRPGEHTQVPHITESCMTTYHTEESRASFMCAFSKMVVKRDGQVRVYACTLVDDDPDYDLGQTLAESMTHRIMLKHHRCFSCFACGASCSER